MNYFKVTAIVVVVVVIIAGIFIYLNSNRIGGVVSNTSSTATCKTLTNGWGKCASASYQNDTVYLQIAQVSGTTWNNVTLQLAGGAPYGSPGAISNGTFQATSGPAKVLSSWANDSYINVTFPAVLDVNSSSPAIVSAYYTGGSKILASVYWK